MMHPDEPYTPAFPAHAPCCNPEDAPPACDHCRDNEADCGCKCCAADHDRLCETCCAEVGACKACAVAA